MNRKKKFKSEISKELLQRRILDRLNQGIFMPPKRPGIKAYNKKAKLSLSIVDEVLNKMSNDTLFGDAVKEALDSPSVKDSFDSYYDSEGSSGEGQISHKNLTMDLHDTEETNVSQVNTSSDIFALNSKKLRKKFIFE